ncbi:hypothetical protein [Sphingomonas aliaeris]|nr:hypothetical protein [Sphingomonas aliaeris]
MTFARMIILAITTAMLSHASGTTRAELVSNVLGIVCLAYVAWCWTKDPLPDAVEKALDRYASKWRNR